MKVGMNTQVKTTNEKEEVMQLKTVGDLIDHLQRLGRDRILIVDHGGDTHHVTTNDIRIWNENDRESPVALFMWTDGEEFFSAEYMEKYGHSSINHPG
jgi:hypothetical protein